jgi:transcriptional regulator with XRE-family HTH domain
MSIGERIKAIRKDRGIKQFELAKKIGVSLVTMNHYERGIVEPSWFNAICIADALGVSLDYLAGRDRYLL